MLNKKKVQYADEHTSTDRIANLCQMLRHRQKTTVTPAKITSVRQATKPSPHSFLQSNKQNLDSNLPHPKQRPSIRLPQRPKQAHNDSSISSNAHNSNHNCKNHPGKAARYEFEYELYCEKCAIELTSQGKRLMRRDARRIIEECLAKEIDKVRIAYAELLGRLKREFDIVEAEIRRCYEQEMLRVQEGQLIEIVIYKPCTLNHDWNKKLKEMAGSTQLKVVDLAKQKHNTSTHTNSCSSFSEITRPASSRAKPTIVDMSATNFIDSFLAKMKPDKSSKSIMRHQIQNILQ